MAEQVKLEEKELEQIRDLQKAYIDVQTALGQTHMAKLGIEKQMDDLLMREDELNNRFHATRSDENDLVTSLSEKYGRGSLDLQSGVFTPSEENK
tara:strand:+ start:584 stop:868 length:285 start_codon:yes stop_codon:yes gene_type:complete